MAENGSFAALEKWVPPPFRSQLLSLSLSASVAHFQTLSLPKPQPNRVNERKRGGSTAIGLIRHNVARPPDRWNAPSSRRPAARDYRQLESWHQTTMGVRERGRPREEKKPDATGGGRTRNGRQVPISPKCLPPALPLCLSMNTILDHRYSPSSKSSQATPTPPPKISSGFDSRRIHA